MDINQENKDIRRLLIEAHKHHAGAASLGFGLPSSIIFSYNTISMSFHRDLKVEKLLKFYAEAHEHRLHHHVNSLRGIWSWGSKTPYKIPWPDSMLCRSWAALHFIEQDKVSGFWTWMFVLSKLPELGDTVFIVLRKKPLIFLHWYHHITVLLYTWYSFTEYTSSARWFVVMNYCVHSVMYTYYALVSMGKYPPKMMAMTITLLQLTQMVVGCWINIYAHKYLATAPPNTCGISKLNIKLSMAMYFSYFVLFARFFYKAYLAPKGGQKAKSEPLADIPMEKKSSAVNGLRQRNGISAH